ncbi:hypothetical protein [Prosthecobacter sp.]|uniref:hypothetical protein n=1 Tax=Prosthecobacter sp. TaxID=1965333 RepID=UPI002ABC7E8D|nr:hypothetical protein [Prosthecobacter sp.]MDZ4406287.1 hypothetical protein [Prosthecobacter sp.]
MKTLLCLLLPCLLAVSSLTAQLPADAPLTTADLIPLPSDEFDPTLPAAQVTPDPVANGDPDLPQPFDPASLTAIVENSPFTRIVSISDSLVLTGMAYVDGKPVVTIFDKTAKQSIVVSDEPNLKGWKLVGAKPSEKIDYAQAQIAIGGETFSIRHSSLTKDDMRKDKSERREGGPGGPPPPGGGDRFSRGSRGPSEEDRKRYESLSESGKEKLRNVFREKFSDEKFRNAPEEERRNIIKSAVEKIEKDEKGKR